MTDRPRDGRAPIRNSVAMSWIGGDAAEPPDQAKAFAARTVTPRGRGTKRGTVTGPASSAGRMVISKRSKMISANIDASQRSVELAEDYTTALKI
jgi:hypothetical protein